MASVVENLKAAKALIDTPEKWRKDDNHKLDSCCAIVAANRAIGAENINVWHEDRSAIWSALYEALPIEWQDGNAPKWGYGGLVGDYNDDPDTTHADIMALFDRAIVAEETKDGAE